MSNLQLPSDYEPVNLMDNIYDRMASLVSETGPKLLSRGMPPLEANEAILACLDKLKRKAELAQKLLMELRCYSTGMSALSEEAVQAIVKEFEGA